MEFIRSIGEGGCFLCREAEEGDEMESSMLICRRGKALAVMNRWPYSNGHVLVAPLAHKAELEELDEQEMLDVFSLVRDMKLCLGETVEPHGFNIGINLGRIAGAGLPEHLHVHIVPRWTGDTNFMPVIGDTKVIPQAIEDLRCMLRDAWQGFESAETHQ
jgi:ATP adenylyltransferase